jgi:hypothetical protein
MTKITAAAPATASDVPGSEVPISDVATSDVRVSGVPVWDVNPALPSPAPMQPRDGPLLAGKPRGDPNLAPRCGAKTRTGCACRSPAMRNGRCRMHGGKNTGARTPQGLARLAAWHRTQGDYGAAARAIDLWRRTLRRCGRVVLAATMVQKYLSPDLAARPDRGPPELRWPVHLSHAAYAVAVGTPRSSAQGQVRCDGGRDWGRDARGGSWRGGGLSAADECPSVRPRGWRRRCWRRGTWPSGRRSSLSGRRGRRNGRPGPGRPKPGPTDNSPCSGEPPTDSRQPTGRYQTISIA